ncbi:MAG: phosphonate C-P lyase system protein PhnG [Spirochaetota bacterium]
MTHSEIAAEGPIGPVKEAAEEIVAECDVRVVREPSGATVMVRSVDPLDLTPFNLGEAYVTDCEVEVDGCLGYGCVLGTSRERALYAALLDAVLAANAYDGGSDSVNGGGDDFGARPGLAARTRERLEAAGRVLADERARESSRVASSRVEFTTI